MLNTFKDRFIAVGIKLDAVDACLATLTNDYFGSCPSGISDVSKKGDKAFYDGEHKSAAYKSKDEPTKYFVMVKLDGSELEEVVIGEDGREYEKTDHVPINVNQIPDHVRDDLAKATLEAFQKFIHQPGPRERLDAVTTIRKARESKK